MKRILFILFTIHFSLFTASARETQPIQGTVVSAANQYIQYTGRISFTNPEHPAWNYPGTQIIAASGRTFQGIVYGEERLGSDAGNSAA